MAEFSAELRTYILADSGIAALISDRLFQISIPQNSTWPACAYQVGLNDFYESHAGSLNIARTLITVACVSQTYSEALTLSNSIKTLLHNFRGNIGATPVQIISYQDSRQTKDDDLDLYIIELDFTAEIEP